MSLTKLPWHVEPGNTYNFGHAAIYAADQNGAKVADVLHEPDAAFLVKAANEHGRLVEQVEQLRAQVETLRRQVEKLTPKKR